MPCSVERWTATGRQTAPARVPDQDATTHVGLVVMNVAVDDRQGGETLGHEGQPTPVSGLVTEHSHLLQGQVAIGIVAGAVEGAAASICHTVDQRHVAQDQLAGLVQNQSAVSALLIRVRRHQALTLQEHVLDANKAGRIADTDQPVGIGGRKAADDHGQIALFIGYPDKVHASIDLEAAIQCLFVATRAGQRVGKRRIRNFHRKPAPGGRGPGHWPPSPRHAASSHRYRTSFRKCHHRAIRPAVDTAIDQ